MFQALKIVMVALVLIAAPVSITAKVHGSGGGGGVKPVTVRLAGPITSFQVVPEGVRITLGVSYYATGTVIANSSTKIRVNGVGDLSVRDLRIGDFAEVEMIPVSRIAYKIEAVGRRYSVDF